MPTDQPIACTLTAAELPERFAEIRAIGATSLLYTRVGEAEAFLLFEPDPQTRERLEAIVAAESLCCAFLALDVKDTRDGLLLTIRAPDGGEQVMRQLVDVFRGGAPAAA